MKTIEEAFKQAHWWFTALLVGAVLLLLAGMGVAVYFGNFASASTTVQHEHRIITLEEHRVSEDDWRRWMVEQIGAISLRVGAPVLPAPPTPPVKP